MGIDNKLKVDVGEWEKQAQEQAGLLLEHASLVFTPLESETTKTLQHIFDVVKKLTGDTAQANKLIETIITKCEVDEIDQKSIQRILLSPESDIRIWMQNLWALWTYLESQENKVTSVEWNQISENQKIVAVLEDAKDKENVAANLLAEKFEIKSSVLSKTNTRAMNYLQATKLSIPQAELSKIQLSIPSAAQQKLEEKWRSADTYRTYVYALHHPDQMPAWFRDIIGTQNPQELITSMNMEYGISVNMVTDDMPPSDTKRSFEAVTYSSTAIVPETWKQRDGAGFDNIFTTFSDAALDKNSALQAPLDAAITSTFNADRCVDTRVVPQVSKPWFESISVAWLQESTSNFTTVTPDLLRDLMQGVVPTDKTERALQVFIKNLKERSKRIPWQPLSAEQKITDKKLDAMLDAIIKKRFLTQTQQIAKIDVAQSYLGQVADVLKMWGQNMMVHGGAEGVKYMPDGSMQIDYHTAQAPDHVESLVITADGSVRMSSLIASSDSDDPSRRTYMMEKWMYTLPGSVLTMRAMAARYAANPNRFTAARSLHIKQSWSYDPSTYRKTLLENSQDPQPTSDQQHANEVIRAAMHHSLASTKLMDVIVHETQSRPGAMPDAFVSYYQGRERFVDKRQHTELQSLFALRNTCTYMWASDIQQCTEAMTLLSRTYPPTLSPDRTPLLAPNPSQAIYSMMEYFTTTGQTEGGGFDVSAFTRFITVISHVAPPPSNIDDWLAEKEERIAYVPFRSVRRLELEKKSQNKVSEGLQQELDAAYK